MTPNELYALPVLRVSRNLTELSDRQVCGLTTSLWSMNWNLNERVEIRWAYDHNCDHRRTWQLGSVWFDFIPVMVVQNAGRNGDDFARSYVTDIGCYRRMLQYLHSLIIPQVDSAPTPADADSDIPGLTSFYGHSIAWLDQCRY